MNQRDEASGRQAGSGGAAPGGLKKTGPTAEETVQSRQPGPAPAGRQNVAAVEAMYQFVLWLVPVLEGLPRSQKFLLGDRIQSAALDVLDHLIEAAYSRDRAGLLKRANLGLEKLRFWIRLTKDLKLLDFKRYEHAARCIDDIGRQVGGWLRSQRTPSSPSSGEHDATPA